jgi:hypothetical protein
MGGDEGWGWVMQDVDSCALKPLPPSQQKTQRMANNVIGRSGSLGMSRIGWEGGAEMINEPSCFLFVFSCVARYLQTMRGKKLVIHVRAIGLYTQIQTDIRLRLVRVV